MSSIPEDSQRASALKSFAARASLAVAVVLVAIKLAAWSATGSIALLTSAVDALVDTAASLITYSGVRYAERPPDRQHRFGHGKGEAVAAYTQATILGGAGFVLAIQAVERLIFPQSLDGLEIGVWVILASLLAAAALVAMQTWVVRKTGSTAIAADKAHYLTDVAVNVAVLLALGITILTGWTRADPAFAFAISGYMLWTAYEIATEALVQLLDRELSTEDRRRIKEAVLACEGVRAIHDLRTRSSGDRVFVEYHLEVNPRLALDVAHAIGDATETTLKALLPGTVEVTAHMEPYGIDDERLDDAVRRGTAKKG
jgi:ferrous-iron efflux pump FieF